MLTLYWISPLISTASLPNVPHVTQSSAHTRVDRKFFSDIIDLQARLDSDLKSKRIILCEFANKY